MRASFSVALAFVASLVLATPSARADSTVVVLGLANAGDSVELAQTMSTALRVAAGQVEGWAVSQNAANLTQLTLALGCDDPPQPDCFGQISEMVSAQLLVFGSLRRGGDNYELSLSLFDTGAGAIVRTTTETIPGRRTDIDDLRAPARRVIGRLAGPETGTLDVASNVPGASVLVDGAPVGTTDADGRFASSDVRLGAHEVEVRAPGHAPWRGSVTLASGHAMTLDATLEATPSGEDTAPASGSPGLAVNWTGVALLGVGVAAAAVGVYSMSHIGDLNGSADYQANVAAYRTYYASHPIPGGSTDVCRTADANAVIPGFDAAAVRATCGDGSTYEILQYVFLGLGVASAGAGAVLLGIDPTGTGGAQRETPAVSFAPVVGPDRASLAAHVRF